MEKYKQLRRELDELENECKAAFDGWRCNDPDCMECIDFWEEVNRLQEELEPYENSHCGLDAAFIPPKRPRRYKTEEERREARRDTWRRANKKYRAKKKAEKSNE